MPHEQSQTPGTALTTFLQAAACQKWPISKYRLTIPQSRQIVLDREPIQLGLVEFRILLFLASRPYHAFTHRDIAGAINTPRNPVAEDTVDEYVAALLDQLGEYHDYVQSVPHIGYRFKA